MRPQAHLSLIRRMPVNRPWKLVLQCQTLDGQFAGAACRRCVRVTERRLGVLAPPASCAFDEPHRELDRRLDAGVVADVSGQSLFGAAPQGFGTDQTMTRERCDIILVLR